MTGWTSVSQGRLPENPLATTENSHKPAEKGRPLTVEQEHEETESMNRLPFFFFFFKLGFVAEGVQEIRTSPAKKRENLKVFAPQGPAAGPKKETKPQDEPGERNKEIKTPALCKPIFFFPFLFEPSFLPDCRNVLSRMGGTCDERSPRQEEKKRGCVQWSVRVVRRADVCGLLSPPRAARWPPRAAAVTTGDPARWELSGVLFFFFFYPVSRFRGAPLIPTLNARLFLAPLRAAELRALCSLANIKYRLRSAN